MEWIGNGGVGGSQSGVHTGQKPISVMVVPMELVAMEVPPMELPAIPSPNVSASAPSALA